MALEKRTILDQIEITRNGTVQIRWAKEIVDGAQLVTSDYHRTAVPPGRDIDAQIDAVSAHLGTMGWPVVQSDDIQRIKDHAAIAWTPQVISAFEVHQAAQNPAPAA